MATRRDTGILSIADAKKKSVQVASTGTGSPTFLVPSMMNGLLGTKFKIVKGYKGSAKTTMSVEQGETLGMSNSWVSWTKNRGPWFKGGDKSFNSRGSVIMNQAVETQRNPGLTLEQIEDAAKAALKVTHVVWTKRGVVDDEQSFRGSIVNGSKVYTAIGTGGHVDEFCRFAGPSKVLLAQVSEAQRHRSAIAEETYQRLEENAGLTFEVLD